MIHYNNDNNAYCSAVNVHNLETREDNTLTKCNKYIQLYHLQRTKCLHFCLHID